MGFSNHKYKLQSDCKVQIAKVKFGSVPLRKKLQNSEYKVKQDLNIYLIWEKKWQQMYVVLEILIPFSEKH